MSKKRITVLTGAGISAESGIKTFRDAGGLWEGHDVMEVASPEGWIKNRALVIDFYNKRRAQLLEVNPNAGHLGLVELEEQYDVHIVTQNVDDLHERAGSSNIIHLHGELTKVRSLGNERLVYNWRKDLLEGDLCEEGHQLRPHIVWFGEEVPMLQKAAEVVSQSDIILVVGTSMQVYPAAGLVGVAPKFAPIIYIDPKPSLNYEMEMAENLVTIAEVATTGVRKVVDELLG
ncbi:MAG: NAD-dependent deacetylase [Granulosicoccus sp.]|jgi:NAD-dependent deacetylase